MDLQIVMRTADRGQQSPPYLVRTLAQLRSQHIPAEQIHLAPTAPSLRLPKGAEDWSIVHPPSRVYRATENMGIALRNAPRCDWVIHLEDDVRVCADFLGSVSRWIAAHATPADVLVSFFTPSLKKEIRAAVSRQQSAVALPLTKWASAVAFAMRWIDAQAAGAWILEHAASWRVGPHYPAWATHRGADKMIAAWQVQAYPGQPNAIASAPCLVEHDGRVSTLRQFGRFGYVRAPVFTGQPWRAHA